MRAHARHPGQLNPISTTSLVSVSVSSVGGGLSKADCTKIPVIGFGVNIWWMESKTLGGLDASG